jgi:antitoxin MazE
MRTKVQKWGNSLALRIPKPFADEIGLQEDAAVEISLEQDRLVVSRSMPPVIRLEDLLRGITRENLHRAVESGARVGNEAW